MTKKLLLIITISLLIAACNPADAISDAIGNKVAEKVTETIINNAIKNDTDTSINKANVEIKNGKMVIKSNDGKVIFNTGKEIKLPSDFPKDVYMPKKVKIVMAMSITNGYTVTFNSEQTTAELAKQFINESGKLKWKKKSDINAGDQQMLVFQKDKRVLNLIIGKKDQSKGTACQLTVADK